MGLKSIFTRRTDPAPQVEARAEVNFAPGFEALLTLAQAEVSETVTFREALSLPPVMAAINFLSSSLAALPVAVYERKPEGEPDVKIEHPVASLLNRYANDDFPSDELRQVVHAEQFGPGRGYCYVERDRRGDPINLFPLEFSRTTVKRDRLGRVTYEYMRSDNSIVTYSASDVIDLAFSRKGDLISSHSPVLTCAGAIRQGLNASKYALTTFGRNGVPPYVLEGAMPSGDAARRAAEDVAKVARRQAADGKPILPIPAGYKLTRLGDDPEKMQLTEVQVFTVQQVARIYNLPPVFLQELSTGTFNNTEQQDLTLVKHTLAKRAKQSDGAYSLRLFGRDSSLYIKSDLDELARGVFKDRIEALARAIQTAQLTPNEARELSGRSKLDGGDELMIQSATIPVRLIEKKIDAEVAKARAGVTDASATPESDPETPNDET
ncbi:MAG: phage portal protein [Pseudomonadota bacterium]